MNDEDIAGISMAEEEERTDEVAAVARRFFIKYGG